jgi:hypothetical protein
MLFSWRRQSDLDPSWEKPRNLYSPRLGFFGFAYAAALAASAGGMVGYLNSVVGDYSWSYGLLDLWYYLV